MTKRDLALSWVGQTPNTKTGNIPTGYVGDTLEEARASCQGCPLLAKQCYAWAGFSKLSMGRIEDRKKADPTRYSLETALETRAKSAKAVRIGALGDPSRARKAVIDAVLAVRKLGLAVLSYTHFWKEPESAGMEGLLMASCEDVDEADQALAMGWTPAVLLPWDHYAEVGPLFSLPSGTKGVVCPAQTKDAVTCNSCRMCAPDHPVWRAGKVSAIGFLDHSHKARRESIRSARGAQLPMFGREGRDTRPSSRLADGI